ncbi:hypothetical protein [Brachybacterium sp. GPGPB12]|uniref:hypothetical protein n=1 Tax=Brachybacterium sp. GPGPB12 TaxID=3023517 RepID=UPI00313444DC
MPSSSAVCSLLWLVYAPPRTAARREVMGRARAADEAGMTPQARDLSEAVHARRSSAEVTTPMPQDRLLMRPADPTRRPRFDTDPGTRVDLGEERGRSRRLIRGVLIGLVALTAALVVGAVANVAPWWPPVLGAVVLGVFLVGPRRAELERRARRTRAAIRVRQEQAEAETARRRAEQAPASTGRESPAPSAVSAAQRSRRVLGGRGSLRVRARDRLGARGRAGHAPGEWTPRPVPRPTYALRGEVDDLASRHAAHRRKMLPESVPLERAHVEEAEAVEESFAPAQDLHLDEILARRRA